MTRASRHFHGGSRATLALGLSLFGCSPATEAPDPAGPDAHPSVLLVTLDTTRADAMGYESGSEATPGLDALAARGVRFTHAYATAPITLPSHTSMLTGLYPYEHGIRENSRHLSPDHGLLAERMSELGYQAMAVVSGFPLAARFGLARGFEHYDDDFGQSGVERRADATTDRALEAIRASRDSPLFLWVHYYDPHEPYAPPEPYASEYPDDPYLGEIAFMDSAVARLVEAFEVRFGERGFRVLVAGDHGEGLGDHGERLHGNLLYQGVMRVPLVIAGTGIAPGVRTDPVGVRRVFDTILEWAGVARPHDLLAGEREVVLAEAMKPFLQYGWQPQVMAIHGRTKAIRSGGIEIYDLVNDPQETDDLAGRQRLEPELGRALAAYPFDPAFDPATGAVASGPGLAAEERKRLAALGYVDWQGTPSLQENAPSPRDMTHLFAALDAGSASFVRGEYDDAIETFEGVLEQDPGNLMVSLRLAAAHSALGRDRQALDYFQHASRLAPGSPDVDHYLAQHHLRLGRWREAEPLLARVLSAQPERLPALEGLALVRERQGRLREAAQLLERVAATHPEPAAALTKLGTLRMALTDTPAAIRAFERAWSLAGDGFSAFLELGVCYLAERRLADARETLDRALSTHPNHPMALFKRAQVSVLLDEPDKTERVRAAYRHADPATRPLIEGEPLFRGLPFRN